VVKVGIVGLSQAGKTTLFRLLTHAPGGPQAGWPVLHRVVVHVPDARLDRLAQIHGREKVIHATAEYVDTPGSIIELLRRGTQAAILREMDALACVVRAFGNETASPAAGSADPQRDIESVELELVLSDLAVVEKRLERLERDLKKQKSPALEREQRLLQTCKAALEKQTPLRELELTPDEEHLIRGFTFLSQKPMLYVLNLDESEAPRANTPKELTRGLGLKPRLQTAVAAICGKVEAELAELSEADAAEFMLSYGLAETATIRLTRATFQLLGLISFFTIGDFECRAWAVRAGTKAIEAAGEVHSDFQKGFIRAEVIRYDELVAAGGLAEARRHGQLRLEGKEYVIQDGDVVYFRHSG